MTRRGTVALAVALSAAGGAPEMQAQRWTVDAVAGRAVYAPLSDRIGALNASVGLRYAAPGSRFLYLASGVDLGASGPGWGSGGAGGWIDLAGGVLGLDVGSHVYGYSASVLDGGGVGGVVEMAPSVRIGAPSASLEVKSGVVQTYNASRERWRSRVALQGGVIGGLEPASGVKLLGETRYLYLSEGLHGYLGGSVEVERGWGTIWGRSGRWIGGALPASASSAFSAGLSLEVDERTQIGGGWQQHPIDPLFQNAARRSWTVQISRKMGAPRRPAEPVLLPRNGGGVVLRLPVGEHSRAPSVLGEFSGWKPLEMRRAGDHWEIRLPLTSGVYRFGFRSGEGEWFIPETLPDEDDGMGGRSAVLIVP